MNVALFACTYAAIRCLTHVTGAKVIMFWDFVKLYLERPPACVITAKSQPCSLTLPDKLEYGYLSKHTAGKDIVICV